MVGEIGNWNMISDQSGYHIAENKASYSEPLDKRIFNFAASVLRFLKTIKYNRLNEVLIHQLAKSATSIGANYEEAQGASSRNDFLAKLAIAHREARETNYWLRLFAASEIDHSDKLMQLTGESIEIRNILGSIVGKVRNQSKK